MPLCQKYFVTKNMPRFTKYSAKILAFSRAWVTSRKFDSRHRKSHKTWCWIKHEWSITYLRRLLSRPCFHIFVIKNGANFLADFPREHAERGLNVYRNDGDGTSLLGHLTDDRQDGLRWHHHRRWAYFFCWSPRHLRLPAAALDCPKKSGWIMHSLHYSQPASWRTCATATAKCAWWPQSDWCAASRDRSSWYCILYCSTEMHFLIHFLWFPGMPLLSKQWYVFLLCFQTH